MLNAVFRLLLAGLLFSSTAVAQTRQAAPKSTAPMQKGGVPARPASAVRPAASTGTVPRPAQAAPADDASKAGVGEESSAEMEVISVRSGPRIPPQSPAAKTELDKLLKAWSESSDGIDRLEGQVERFVYDTTFETESRSRGEFAYEKPDKGRIDINPVPVTPKVVEGRKKEVELAKQEKRRPEVRVKENGEPYELAESQAEQWWCDGERIYNIDLVRKQAIVNQIPVQMQGGNIMDSPLPFLFGMPPERAKRRFEMGFHGGNHDPASKRARLVIYPNLPQDAQSWRQADVLLDTQTWLPIAVQLHDPAGTKITVYSFSNLKRNPLTFENLKFSRFTPSLKGLNVLTINESEVAPPVVPALGGLHFEEALKQLDQLGLKRTKDASNRVTLEQGNVAPTPKQKFHVEAQTPAPGTPLEPGLKVTLRLYADPAKALSRE
jgi:TIGR03009 family protein